MYARDIMTTDVITVTPQTTMLEAMKLLINIEISGLIVLDEDGEMVGVISEKDVLVAYDFLKSVDSPITNYICKDIISVQEDTPIDEVNKVLVQNNIKRVPVLSEGRLTGVISRRDILAFLYKRHEGEESV